MTWGFDDLLAGIGGLFASGSGDGAGLASVTASAVDALPLPPEFLTEDAASALGGAADAGGSGINWGGVLGGLSTVARVATPIAGALMGTSLIGRVPPSLEVVEVANFERRVEVICNVLKAQEEGVVAAGTPSGRGLANLLCLPCTCLGQQHHASLGS